MSSSLMRLTPVAARLAARTSTPSLSIGLNRSISSTARMEKGPIEATKDTLKKADKAFSGAAVKGIEKGQEATEKIRETAGAAEAKSQELKGEAQEAAGRSKGKAEEALGDTKGKAEEALGDAKGKAKEAYGEAKGKAKETMGS